MAGTGLRIGALMAALLPNVALAQQNDPSTGPDAGRALSLELNALKPSGNGCRASFVVRNGLGGDLEKAAFEIVLFGKTGMVERLLLLDFGKLVADKTKVREFDLKDFGCGEISRVLVNDVAACEGAPGVKEACAAGLALSTRSSVEFDL